MKAWMAVLGMCGVLLAGIGIGAATFAEQGDAGDPADRASVERVVEEMLRERPELVEDALTRLAERRRSEVIEALAADGRHFSIGPKTAAHTVVELFDYQCPYCKSAADFALEASKRKSTRVVFVEYPILSEGSVQAARAAVASIRQGRYLDFHRALMNHKGELDDAAIDALAKRVGLDVQRLRRDMNDAGVDTLLRANHERAAALRVSGTPAFFVNGVAVGGGYNRPALEAALRAKPPAAK